MTMVISNNSSETVSNSNFRLQLSRLHKFSFSKVIVFLPRRRTTNRSWRIGNEVFYYADLTVGIVSPVPPYGRFIVIGFIGGLLNGN
jgi:hypothetical protein